MDSPIAVAFPEFLTMTQYVLITKEKVTVSHPDQRMLK